MNKAKYTCLKCGHSFETKPALVHCPACSHLYLKWHNYQKFIAK